MYENVISQAGAALKNSPLGNSPHIMQRWEAVSWKTLKTGGNVDAAANSTGKLEINLCPGLGRLGPKEQQAAVIREFGTLLYRQGSEKAEELWTKKLCLPLAAQIDAVQAALKSENHPTYRDLVMSFSTLMDRFVATNIVNALIRVSHVHRENSRNLDIRTYGSTMDYCNCRKYHPIVAFVAAYSYPMLDECPGLGLAELVVYDMGQVRERSLADALRRVILEVFNLCRSAPLPPKP